MDDSRVECPGLREFMNDSEAKSSFPMKTCNLCITADCTPSFSSPEESMKRSRVAVFAAAMSSERHSGSSRDPSGPPARTKDPSSKFGDSGLKFLFNPFSWVLAEGHCTGRSHLHGKKFYEHGESSSRYLRNDEGARGKSSPEILIHDPNRATI